MSLWRRSWAIFSATRWPSRLCLCFYPTWIRSKQGRHHNRQPTQIDLCPKYLVLIVLSTSIHSPPVAKVKWRLCASPIQNPWTMSHLSSLRFQQFPLTNPNQEKLDIYITVDSHSKGRQLLTNNEMNVFEHSTSTIYAPSYLESRTVWWFK